MFRVKCASSGFTLIEIMIVVLVSGILISIGLPLYRGYIEEACEVAVQGALERIANEQEKFYFAEGIYSSTLDRLGLKDFGVEGHEFRTEWIKNNGQSYMVEAESNGRSRCGVPGESGFRLSHTGERQMRQGSVWVDGW